MTEASKEAMEYAKGWREIHVYRPRCRDCADNDGWCEHDPRVRCDPTEDMALAVEGYGRAALAQRDERIRRLEAALREARYYVRGLLAQAPLHDYRNIAVSAEAALDAALDANGEKGE